MAEKTNGNSKYTVVDVKKSGNTGLPFGLCEKYGIKIQENWSPRDAWNALKDKLGVNPEEVYKELDKKHEEVKLSNNNEMKMHNYVLTSEDKQVIQNIKNGHYYSLEEIVELPLFKKMDEVAKQIKLDVGGDTSKLNTPKREKQREKFINDFINGTGKAETRPNPLNKEFKMTIIVGLPASGKSSQIANPLSEEQGAFIFDSDEMKKTIPEYKNGANGGGVHNESKDLLKKAQDYFINGDMKGINIVYPFIGDNSTKTIKKIQPFIDAGYDVEIAYKKADTKESVNRALVRAVTHNRPFEKEVIEGYNNDNIVKAFYETLSKGIKRSKYSEL